MRFFAADSEAAAAKPDLAACRLVLPAETVGNVGQLAADLLIETFGMRLVGYLESPHVQPCAGLNAYNSSGSAIHLALELYADVGRSIAVVQQRAPVLRGCQARFAQELAGWAHLFKEVICLGSLDARLRQDAQMSGSQLRFCATDDAAAQLGSSLGVSQLEEELLAAQSSKLMPPWPLLEAARDTGLSMLAMLIFATEGDNAIDAQQLCDAVGTHLQGGGSGDGDSAAAQWRQPVSWQTVYGTPRDISAY